MTGKYGVRTKVNPRALKAVNAGLASGLAVVGELTIVLAGPRAPDQPPYGEGLVERGAWGVFLDGNRVAGTAELPHDAASKPGLTLVAGFPFPARFNERGTVHQPARPFLDPSMVEAIEALPAEMRTQVARFLATVR